MSKETSHEEESQSKSFTSEIRDENQLFSSFSFLTTWHLRHCIVTLWEKFFLYKLSSSDAFMHVKIYFHWTLCSALAKQAALTWRLEFIAEIIFMWAEILYLIVIHIDLCIMTCTAPSLFSLLSHFLWVRIKSIGAVWP